MDSRWKCSSWPFITSGLVWFFVDELSPFICVSFIGYMWMDSLGYSIVVIFRLAVQMTRDYVGGKVTWRVFSLYEHQVTIQSSVLFFFYEMNMLLSFKRFHFSRLISIQWEFWVPLIRRNVLMWIHLLAKWEMNFADTVSMVGSSYPHSSC